MATGRTNAAGGIGLDGVIAEYTAQGGITAGDFVAIVRQYAPNDNARLSSKAPFLQYFSAVELDADTVFIAHADGEVDALFATLITVSSGAISVGASVQLTTGTSSGLQPQAQVLTNGNVFIAHGGSTSYPSLYCVCSVSGGAITRVTSGTIISTAKTANYSVLCKMQDGALAYIFFSGSSYYGIKITANGSGVTISAATQIVGSLTYSLSTAKPCACLMDDGNLLVSHGTNQVDQAFSIISPSFGLLYQGIANQTAFCAIRSTIVRLGENKYLAIRSGGASTGTCVAYARVVSASGTSLSFGEEVMLFAGYERSSQLDCCRLPNGQVLFCCVSLQFGTTPAPHAVIIDISGSAASVAAQYDLSSADGIRGECARCVTLSGGQTLALFSEYDYFYLYGCALAETVFVEKSGNPDAIAIQSCASGGTVKIFVPEKGE